MQEAETEPCTSRQDDVQGGQRRDYLAGQGIFPHGDPGDALFANEGGRVEISRVPGANR